MKKTSRKSCGSEPAREGSFTIDIAVTDIALSRAGSLPQVVYFYATTVSAGETMLVFIPRERPELR